MPQTPDHEMGSPSESQKKASQSTPQVGVSSTPGIDAELLGTPTPAGAKAIGEMPGRLPKLKGYAIESVLGEGGMGIVYRARQLNLDRPVAIKMILAGEHANRALVHRFLNEIEAIGKLQHPNIVQVFDRGIHNDLPYLVMELVDGSPLHEEQRRRPLGFRDAAHLCHQLARAMDSAHRQGIVHRDLKPSNVMVTLDGIPKIMDFGLAKRSDIARDLTTTGNVLGTPGYLSPEQAQGRSDRIGPASDIFALGVILYELTCGHRPFDGATAVETITLIIKEDPPPPSWYRPGIPRDLETICLKCLNKNPVRRYASASELADDLQRYLRGHVIQARRTSRVERCWKWSLRHPGWATVILLAAVSIPVALTALGIHNQRLSAMLARSERLVDRNSDFSVWVIQDFLQQLRNVNGSTELQLELLSQIRQLLQRTQAESVDDPVLKRRVGASYESVADVLGNPNIANLGRTNEAIVTYKQAYELLHEAHTQDPADPVTAICLARTALKTAAVVAQTDGFAAAQPWIDCGQTMIEKHGTESDDWFQVRVNLAENRFWQAFANNDIVEMERFLREAESLLAAAPKAFEHKESIEELAAWIAESNGQLEMVRGNYVAAADSFRRLVELFEARTSAEPSNDYWKNQVATAQVHLGDALISGGELDAAGEKYATAIETRKQLLQRDPQNARQQMSLSVDYERYAKWLLQQQRWEEAKQQLQECIQLRELLLQTQTPNQNQELVRSLWIAHIALADVHSQSGELDAADANYQTAQQLVDENIASGIETIAELQAIAEISYGLGTVDFLRWLAVGSEGSTAADASSEIFQRSAKAFERALEQYTLIEQRGPLTFSQSRLRDAAQEMLDFIRDTAERLAPEDAPDNRGSDF